MKTNNLLSVEDYATLCGVTKAAIYDRIKKNTITATRVKVGKDSCLVIDRELYRPEKLTAGRKKFKMG